jgi:hypothetical protein
MNDVRQADVRNTCYAADGGLVADGACDVLDGDAGGGLGTRQHLALPPGLDRVRLDRHDRVPGFRQQVDQAAVGPLEGDRHAAGRAVTSQPTQQQGDPVGGMGDRELGGGIPGGVYNTHGMGLGGQSIPVKNSASCSANDDMRTPCGGSDDPARRTATGWSLTGALRRFSLLPVRAPAGTGGGGVMLAVFRRPPQTVTPAPAESQQRANITMPAIRMVP